MPPADSLRAVLDSVFSAPEYQWVQPRNPFGWIGRLWHRLLAFLAEVRGANHLVFEAIVWALVAVLAVIVGHAAWVFIRTMRAAAGPAPGLVAHPIRAPRDAAWYEREADRLAAEGRFAAALEAAFLALVLQLDSRGLVRFHPSKTPREYVGEAPRSARDQLATLTARLYRYVFGGAPCGADDYREWRSLAAETGRVAAA